MRSESRRSPATATIAVLIVVAAACSAPAQDVVETAALPFSVSLGEAFTIDGMPGLQSYACGTATVDGRARWLFVTGMVAGVHGFSADPADQTQNFPRRSANASLLVVDVEAKRAWSAPLSSLSKDSGLNAAALSVSSAAFAQQGDTLYIVGGYGHDPRADEPGHMDTSSTLTAIDLPTAIQAVVAGAPFDASIRQTTSPILRSAGGGMSVLGGQFYLGFGQTFAGLYSPVEGDPGSFEQNYLPRVVVFNVKADAKLSVDIAETIILSQPDGTTTRRRDFTQMPAMLDAKTPAIGIYGGVFRPSGYHGYMNPIYIAGLVDVPGSPPTKGITPGLDAKAEQRLSQYACAAVPVFAETRGEMHSVFFGGISEYHYEKTKGALVKDPVKLADGDRKILQDGMPYIPTVSSLRRRADGTTDGFILPCELPGLLGAGAQMLLDPSVPVSENGVILLDKLKGPTVVGHIFGGIRSTAPYSTESAVKPATTASNLFIPVTITPGSSQVTPMPAAPPGG